MTRATELFFIVSLLPVLIYSFAGSKDIDFRELKESDTSEAAGGIDWSLLSSWVLWLYSGFFSLGSLAGEVREPQRNYPIVALGLVPLVGLVNIWPLAVSISRDNNRTNYDAGHFDELSTELCGEWYVASAHSFYPRATCILPSTPLLSPPSKSIHPGKLRLNSMTLTALTLQSCRLSTFFVIGSCVSNIGLFNGDMVVCERSLASFVDPYIDRYTKKDKNIVVRYLFTENGTGIAPVYIIVNAAVASGLTWLPYESLVEFQMLQFGMSSLLCMYAFIWYKVRLPEQARPFRVPGGQMGAILLCVPVAVINLANMYWCLVDSTALLGVPYAKSVAFAIITATGFIARCVWFLFERLCRTRKQSEQLQQVTSFRYARIKNSVDSDGSADHTDYAEANTFEHLNPSIN